jgi:hypothetical protein
MHMHDLLTSEQHERMLANGWREQTDDSFDPEPVVKLILPGLGMAWLLTSLDPDIPELAFGLCGLGFGTPELGSVPARPRQSSPTDAPAPACRRAPRSPNPNPS